MCLGNLQKVFGALDPHRSWDICSIQPSFGDWHSACRCVNTCQANLEMFLCVSGTSKKVFGAWGPNRSWDIDLLFLHVFPQLRPVLGPSTLPAGVSTPVKWSRYVSICLKNLQWKYLRALVTSPLQKVFGAMDPHRSWYISSIWASFGHWHSACRCVNTCQVI